MSRPKIPSPRDLAAEANRARAAATKVPEWKTIMDEEAKQRAARAAKQRAARLALEADNVAKTLATPPRRGSRKS